MPVGGDDQVVAPSDQQGDRPAGRQDFRGDVTVGADRVGDGHRGGKVDGLRWHTVGDSHGRSGGADAGLSQTVEDQREGAVVVVSDAVHGKYLADDGEMLFRAFGKFRGGEIGGHHSLLGCCGGVARRFYRQRGW